MQREGLTITFEYREGKDIPYAIRTEIPMHKIDMADKDFIYMLEHITKNMWLKLEKELFDRA